MNGIWLARGGSEVADTVNGGGLHFLALYGALLLVALLAGWFWRSRRR